MECRKCKNTIEEEDILVEIVEHGGIEKLDIQAVCSECDHRCFFFVDTDDMIDG